MLRGAWLLILCILLAMMLAVIIGCGSTSESRRQPYNTGPQASAGPLAGSGPASGPQAASQVPTEIMIGIRMSPEEAVGAGSPYANDWAAFVKAMADRGFNMIVMQVVEPTVDTARAAKFYFEDESLSDQTKLSDHGFEHADSPQVQDLITAIDEWSKTSGKRMYIYADISRLALSSPDSPLVDEPLPGDALTSQQAADVVKTLCVFHGFDGVIAAGFPDEWTLRCTEAAESTQARFLTAEGFLGDSPQLAGSTGYALLDYDALDMGVRTLAFSGAAQLGRHALAVLSYAGEQAQASPLRAAWDSLKKAQNALRYRTLVSRPAGVILDLTPAELQQIDSDLVEKIRQNLRQPLPTGADAPKVCNVILAGKLTNEAIVDGITTVVNGITSAGYKAVLTAQPLPTADAYYVLALPGEDGNLVPLPGSLVSLFQKPSKVFLQVAGPLPDVTGEAPAPAAEETVAGPPEEQPGPAPAAPNATPASPPPGPKPASASEGPSLTPGQVWNAVRVAFGINRDHFEPLTEVPAKTTYAGTSFAFGKSVGQLPFGSRLTPDNLVGAEPLCTGEGPLADVVLISSLKQGETTQKVFVNAAALDLEAAFVISQILADGGGLQAPTTALCNAKPTLVMFAANGDAVVKIKVGNVDAATEEFTLKDGELRIVERGARPGARSVEPTARPA